MPKLLLLDCPFEGLDHGSREDLCQFIAFISLRHSVQVILVDDHHHLPACITSKLTLDRFQIEKNEKFFSPTVDQKTPAKNLFRIRSGCRRTTKLLIYETSR